MTVVEKEARTDLEETGLSEAAGSHQRLLAVLAESHSVSLEPDPCLGGDEADRSGNIELRLYSL